MENSCIPAFLLLILALAVLGLGLIEGAAEITRHAPPNHQYDGLTVSQGPGSSLGGPRPTWGPPTYAPSMSG